MFKRVYVEITNVCNLSCVFCPGTERAKRFLSPAEFRLMAEKLRGNRRLAPGLFLESAQKFDWPSPDAAEGPVQFCHALRQQIAVLCDGTVVPCCLDGEGRMALGNLLTQQLPDILNTPRAQTIREGFSRRRPAEGLCRRCGYAQRFSL